LKEKILFITDLDGTLLDETYDYKPIEKFIQKLKKYNVSVVFSSSKTRKEQEYYRNKLHLNEPFVVEIGCAVFIPKNYFSSKFPKDKTIQGYDVIELGLPSKMLSKILDDYEKISNINLKRFSKISPEEVSEITGLPLEMAKWAQEREYSEVIVRGFPEESEFISTVVNYLNLNVYKSAKLLTVIGNTDKGRALRVLESLYSYEYESIEIISAGDGESDIPMLLAADLGIFVSNGREVPEVIRKDSKIFVVNNREELMKFVFDYIKKRLG